MKLGIRIRQSMERPGAWLRVFCIFGILPILPLAGQKNFSVDELSQVFIDNQELMRQEKVYMQTDKPFYTAGDTIWTSMHLVLADTHQPSPFSGFVLVELYDPNSKLVDRFKVPADRLGFFSAAIPLSAGLTPGFYNLRAYTKRMESEGTDFFFKRTLFIGNTLKSDKNNNLLKTNARVRKRAHGQGEKALDLQFMPEGGHLIAGCMGKVAFKAIGSDGHSLEVNGTIRNSKKEEIGSFSSSHLGMGTLVLLPVKGEQYTAIVEGSEETFPLPLVEDSAINLQVSRHRGELWISLIGNQSLEGRNCWLMVHSRGHYLFSTPVKSLSQKLELTEQSLPTGIVHFALMSGSDKVLSDRLIFVLRSDSLNVQSSFTATAGRRQPIHGSILLKDKTGAPISGNFSISITDNGQISRSENEENIWSHLLLTSDLKGNIENPGIYFNPKNTNAAAMLDLVMMTQGWSRFNVIDRLAPMDSTKAPISEKSLHVSGMVRNIIGKPASHFPVTLLGPKVGILESTLTNSTGHFSFDNLFFPDSTRFAVQATSPNGYRTVDISVDEEKFPPPPDETVQLYGDSTIQKAKNYDANVRMRYYKNGNTMNVEMAEITVTAEKVNERKRNSPYNFMPDYEVGKDILDHWGGDIYKLLNTLPGVRVVNEVISIRNSSYPPMLVLDGVPEPIESIGMLMTQNIESIEILKDFGRTGSYGPQARGGIISIWMKIGADASRSVTHPSLTVAEPLGYYRSATFYQPKYDVAAIRNDREHDMRTTMYWCPNLRAKTDGIINLDFYSGDSKVNYQLVLEGVGDNGELVHYTCPITP
ncbi:MAG TPA: MG2 domain-containing protein [Bacteroidales bacterium]|nr:MG2 domain-containing protein [Bacteroidales bacterium]